MANDDDNVLQNDTASTQSVSETTANIPLPILPEELIIDILLRLPVKSLLQFKCVCKSWKTLISDPQFAKNQLRISTAYPRLISAVRIDGHCKNVSYPVEPLLEQENQSVNPVISTISYEYNIIGSCNGLLCLLDWNHRFRLWNPSIKLKSKSKRSPTISSFVRPRIAHFGFGYDHVNDKYKVLASVYNTNKYNNGQIFTGIYTFGGDDDSWRNIQDFPCHPSFKMGICMCGTLNWVVRRSVNFCDGVILSFDLENETYREILLPRLDVDEDDVYTTARMEVLNNCLCVCFGSFASNNPHWTVWMMKEFGAVESWTKLFTIPLWSCPSTSIEPYIVQPLFISENGIFLMKDKGDQLALYNFREGGLHIQLISTEFGLNMQHIFIYHESLVSPRCW